MPKKQEIRDRMTRIGVSQVDLAREVGVGKSTIRAWLRGEPSPRQSRLMTEALNRFAERGKVID